MNAVAAEKGLLQPSGTTFKLDTVDYNLGDDMVVVDLHQIAFMCNHEPI